MENEASRKRLKYASKVLPDNAENLEKLFSEMYMYILNIPGGGDVRTPDPS